MESAQTRSSFFGIVDSGWRAAAVPSQGGAARVYIRVQKIVSHADDGWERTRLR